MCDHAILFQEYRGSHLGEFCLECGQWLRWVPQSIDDPGAWLMPIGKHKGTPLRDVPQSYLTWFLEETRGDKPSNIVRRIQDYLKSVGTSG